MCCHFLSVAVYFPLNRNCALSNGALPHYCSLTSCVELWSHAPVSCYRILQNVLQRYPLHTAFYSSCYNFQLFPPNAGNRKSSTNRFTIQFQFLSHTAYQNHSLFHSPTLTDSLCHFAVSVVFLFLNLQMKPPTKKRAGQN